MWLTDEQAKKLNAVMKGAAHHLSEGVKGCELGREATIEVRVRFMDASTEIIHTGEVKAVHARDPHEWVCADCGQTLDQSDACTHADKCPKLKHTNYNECPSCGEGPRAHRLDCDFR